jgi:hypothetical protein
VNPIILYDNRFLDGVTTATDTADGFNVLNITDLKPFTWWKAQSAGPKYLSVDCGAQKFADSLGMIGHDLSSVGAQVSVESSDNGSDWTERLPAFTPSSDKAFLQPFTGATARYWRLWIDSPTSAPSVAVVILGSRMTFPFPVDAPFAPIKEQVATVGKKSKTGHLLAHHVKYKPFTISARLSYPERTWVDSVFLPFWLDYGSDLHPFFWAWDLDMYPEDVRFVRFEPGYSYSPSVSILHYYDSISLELEGVRENVPVTVAPPPPPPVQ